VTDHRSGRQITTREYFRGQLEGLN
jgi:hypothetical protein